MYSVTSVLLDSVTLWTARLLCPWDSPDKNTGVGSLSLLQQIFLTQELNLSLLHCRWILYQLGYQESHKTFSNLCHKYYTAVFGYYTAVCHYICSIRQVHINCLQFSFKINYLFLPVLSLFSSCGKWGLLSSFGVQASHCSGFPCCGARALGQVGSVVATPRLSRAQA